jgi:hypothetical protein
MHTEKFPWEEKRSKQIIVRLTVPEHEEIREVCRQRAIKSMGEYLRILHHKAMGRLKEESRADA